MECSTDSPQPSDLDHLDLHGSAVGQGLLSTSLYSKDTEAQRGQVACPQIHGDNGPGWAHMLCGNPMFLLWSNASDFHVRMTG